jgi:hypothetical protein
MNDVTSAHREAMRLAEAAFLARRRGEVEEAMRLTERAFERERAAADAVADRHDLEPTRSVLHRSAASLALQCKRFREAERLVARALLGEPPPAIADELRSLRDEARRKRERRGPSSYPKTGTD